MDTKSGTAAAVVVVVVVVVAIAAAGDDFPAVVFAAVTCMPGGVSPNFLVGFVFVVVNVDDDDDPFSRRR